MHDDLINSWKEIAAYLGRGIRTVQRWESELRLPVHRTRGRARSAVMAFKSELNTWMRNGEGRSTRHPLQFSKSRFDQIQQTFSDLESRRVELEALRARLRTHSEQIRMLVRSARELSKKRTEATNGNQLWLSDRCAVAQEKAAALCIKSGHARANAQAALKRSRGA
jgi:hypothetical protein